jgi:hypothetical protein
VLAGRASTVSAGGMLKSAQDVGNLVVALRAHASQTSSLIQAVGLDEFGRWWSTDWKRR